jgi:peptidoglycan/xylan/chitin deacetylase (PgdA/CDA1 family)
LTRANDVPRRTTSIVPVLLYHSVCDRPQRGRDRWTLSRPEFVEHANAIAACGRTPLRITELAAGLRGERLLPERAVGITFDDGYADNLDAVGELAQRNLSSTVYVTTGEVGRRGMLSAASLAELCALPGVEVGAHGVRHLRLDELDDSELIAEVYVSKAQLEDLTQSAVPTFAYPHGAYDRRAREAVIRAGYRSAAAVKNALSHSADDPFAIARWTVPAGTPPSRIAEVLDGKGIEHAWTHERVRTRAYRRARCLRRSLAAYRARARGRR